jgi:hypothetical protein
MLITKTHHDVPSKLDNGKPIRIFVIAPVVPNYPQAKFPGTFPPLLCPFVQCILQSTTDRHRLFQVWGGSLA